MNISGSNQTSDIGRPLSNQAMSTGIFSQLIAKTRALSSRHLAPFSEYSSITTTYSPSSSPIRDNSPKIIQQDETLNAEDLTLKDIEYYIQKNNEEIISICSKDIIDKFGYTLIDLAVRQKRYIAAAFLANNGAPISHQSMSKIISSSDSPRLLEIFLKNGGPLDKSSLSTAINDGKYDMIDMLLKHPEAIELDGGHAISCAALDRNEKMALEMIQKLLKAGCKIGMDAVGWAHYSSVCKLLLDNNAPFESSTAIEGAAEKGFDEAIEELVKRGAIIRTHALNRAARHGHQSTVDTLIRLKAPMDKSDIIKHAGQSGSIEILEKLLNYGASISKGCLGGAVRGNHFHVIDFLMSRGAQLTSEDLRIAIGYENENMANFLIQKGAPFSDGLLSEGACFKLSDEFFNFILERIQNIPKDAIQHASWASSDEKALKRVQAIIQRGGQFNESCLYSMVSYSYWQTVRYLLDLDKERKTINYKEINLSYFLKGGQIDLAFDLLKHTSIRFDGKSLLSEDLNSTFDICQLVKEKLSQEYQFQFDDQELAGYINTLIELLSEKYALEKEESFIDVIQLLGKAISLHHNRKIPFESAILFSMEPSLFVWRKYCPGLNVINDFVQYSPYGFNFEVFQELWPLAKKASKLEGQDDNQAFSNAYKLSVFFDSAQEALDYVNSFNKKGDKGQARPFHDACLFELPKKGAWDIPAWRNLMRRHKFSPKKMLFLSLAADLEEKLNCSLSPISSMREKVHLHLSAQEEAEIQEGFRRNYQKTRAKSLEELEKKAKLISDRSKKTKKPWQEIYNKLIDQQNSEQEGFVKQKTQERMDELWKKELVKAYKQEIIQKLKPSLTDTSDEVLLEACKSHFKFNYSLFAQSGEKKDQSTLPKQAKAELEAFIEFLIDQRDLEKQSYSSLVKIALKGIYGDVPPEYKAFAKECIIAGIRKDKLEECIKIIKTKSSESKQVEYIPDVKIDGALIGQSDYFFEKMSFKNPMIFILGKKTGCCYSIDGASRDCVLHGAKSPYGANVRIMKGDAWVAQSWVGLGITEKGEVELIFDSIENNKGYDPKIIMELYALAAHDILLRHPGITRVVFGDGGNTPKGHGFPVVAQDPANYSRIIGYRAKGYDSKEIRYILAEQNQMDPKRVALVKGLDHSKLDESRMPKEGSFVVTTGKDTFIAPGKKTKGLSLNALDRARFFKEHPRAYALLKSHPKNPLLEEGYLNKKDRADREHYGEMFLPYEAIKRFVEKKIIGNAKYKVDHIVMEDNNLKALTQKLKETNLKEGENALICHVEGVHAILGYVEKVNGKVRCALLDPESPCTEGSDIYQAIQAAFNPDKSISFTAKLQIDFFSCSTFTSKAMMYLAKHGRTLFDEIDQPENLIEKGSIFYLKEGKTPPTLLKTAQSEIIEVGAEKHSKFYIEVEKKVFDQIVSRKKGMTLAKYLLENTKQIGGRYYNTAAIQKKYKYLHEIESTFTS